MKGTTGRSGLWTITKHRDDYLVFGRRQGDDTISNVCYRTRLRENTNESQCKHVSCCVCKCCWIMLLNVSVDHASSLHSALRTHGGGCGRHIHVDP
jgi:hypothetical protein